MNIHIYGSCDKRPLVLGLLKLLQDFGSVMFITQEYHYRRMILGNDFGYFQSIAICCTTETPDSVFKMLHTTPHNYDFIIWDTFDYIPDNIDISYICTAIQDELLMDDIKSVLDNPVEVKFMYDGKKDNGVYNIPVNMNLMKYVELSEARKTLDSYKFPELIKVFQKTLSEKLDVPEKTIKTVLQKRWDE